jgi:hypothetical protein
MDALLLQDFISVSAASTTQIVQSPSGWIDLGEIEDVVLYTDIRETSGTGTLAIETSPTMQNGSFVSLVSFTPAVGLRTDVVTAYLAKVPAARFLRWSLTAPVGTTGDATFRIWVAAYGWA